MAEPLELSEDHKPNLASESKRIVAAGGFVTTYAYEDESRLNGAFHHLISRSPIDSFNLFSILFL